MLKIVDICSYSPVGPPQAHDPETRTPEGLPIGKPHRLRVSYLRAG